MNQFLLSFLCHLSLHLVAYLFSGYPISECYSWVRGGLRDAWPDRRCHLGAPCSSSHLPNLLYGPPPWHNASWVYFLGKTTGKYSLSLWSCSVSFRLCSRHLSFWVQIPSHFFGNVTLISLCFSFGMHPTPWETVILGVLFSGQQVSMWPRLSPAESMSGEPGSWEE